MQLNITAKGCWPSEVSLACCKRFLFTFRLLTNLLLPSVNSPNAIDGVMAACISFVSVFIYCLIFMLRNTLKTDLLINNNQGFDTYNFVGRKNNICYQFQK